ncbi:MAG: three-Cys-motif partner protein TcmP [Candidatus Competibacteraceae bacterium]|nr:three-Cys-motif partner protein TcmP [Candidatus Competibacteraceae bacterium]
MSTQKYDWNHGPALIQQHSIAKHRILQTYLAAYFQTLISSPYQESLKLTLIDGFAGGGMYVHSRKKDIVKGSPLIFLDSAREAEFLINKDRIKPIKFLIDYFFIEAERPAYTHLDKVLREAGHGSRIGNEIHLRHARFQDEIDSIITFIRNKTPQNGRSIFVLDQYGYKEVPTQLIRRIFTHLPSAEVILTFGVDSFLNYATDSDLTQALLDGIGIPDVLQGRSISEIKSSERHWRLFIQSALYRNLVDHCGAKYYTPFFIRNQKGHGDYWLIHLSQHHKARDVMTEVHWKHNNHFIHYGGSGLDMFQMLGYNPDYDAVSLGQSALGFEFDDVARRSSVTALMEQIPRRIYANDEGLSFGVLFATTCNGSPASAQIYREAISTLLEEKVIEVFSKDRVKRRSAYQIKLNDQMMAPPQRRLFID